MKARTVLFAIVGLAWGVAGCHTGHPRSGAIAQDATTGYFENQLCAAAASNNLDELKLLLKRGTDSDERVDGKTALMLAVQNGHCEAARLLLDGGADVDAKPRTAITPLMLAAANGQTNLVELLLKRGADIKLRASARGETALFGAASCGRTEVVRILLDHGADVESPLADGTTALMTAAEQRHLDTVRLLLERGADVRRRSEKGTAIGLVQRHLDASHAAARPSRKDADAYAAIAALLLEHAVANTAE